MQIKSDFLQTKYLNPTQESLGRV